MADDLDSFDPVRGPARERIDAQELSDPDDRGAVLLDRRRRRPRYFDDRFLTARDLTRNQQYTLLRQADLAQLSGGGIVHGLAVHTDQSGTHVRIDPGLGIARTGESMALRRAAELTLAKLRVVAAQIRTTKLLAESAATRAGTGMYVLVARPVEYSRNAVMTFPDGTLAKLALADTEIVEGTWFSLMLLPGAGPNEIVGRGRARLAREVFVGGFDPTLATDGLALAVVGVVNGRVQWVDQALASRSVGGDAQLGFGLQGRKLRLAYQAQYTRHLADVVEQRRHAGLPDGLPASTAFAALPPVGPLPRGAIQVTTSEVRQSFFPREIYVELAIMPDDELPALLAEGLARAPIDLEADGVSLEGVPVLIVVPVSRASFDQLTPRMQGIYRAPALESTVRQVVNARPIDALGVLRRKTEPAVWSDPLPLDLEAWRKAVESATQLWYVRRRQFASASVVVPRIAAFDDDQPAIEMLSDEAQSQLLAADEIRRFNQLFGGASKDTLAAIDKLLSNKLFEPAEESSVYVSGMIGELAYLSRRGRPPVVPERFDTARSLIPLAPVPRSPVFTDIPLGDRLRLRPLELADVERVAWRFSLPGINKSLRQKSLAEPPLRSVLASSCVVPELAWLVLANDITGTKIAARIARLAALADIAGLRALAKDVTLQFDAHTFVESDFVPPSLDHTLASARSFELLRKLGEDALLRAIWPASHPTFREQLDELLMTLASGSQPVFATALLMQVLTIGFALPVDSDVHGREILDALRKHEFVAPNHNAGKLLATSRSRSRDAVVKAAASLPVRAVVSAQSRLSKLGFAEGQRLTRSPSDIYRLLALASCSFAHITTIANADPAALKPFAELARSAADRRSLTRMREALAALAGPVRR
jgi:hypothetical protein